MLKTLSPYLRGYGLRTALASITVALEVLVEVYIPFLMADIINVGVANGDMGFIVRRGALMIAMAFVALAFGALSARIAVVASTGFAANVRRALFEKVQGFSFANVDKFSTASLITRLTTDIGNLQQSFTMIIRMCVRAPVMLIAATIMAIRVNGELAIVFAFSLPVLAGAILLIIYKAFPMFQRMLGRLDHMNSVVQEGLINIRVIKAFVREDYENGRFYESAKAVRDAQIKAERVIIWNGPISNFVLYASMIAVCYIGGNFIIHGSMQTGDLMSFISYVSQILFSLMMMSMVFVMLVLTRASVARIVEVFSEKNDLSDADADPSLAVHSGSIDFEDVCFSYGKGADNLILEHVNLSIRAGETIGIIGGTGSAKTTLVQLIPRLYDVSSGSVKVDGRDVRDYTFKNLRDNVAMVLQKNVLFSGSIAENLRWGDVNATDAELEEAADAAAAHGFITAFPDGYNTDLGQGGVNVSGGQRQRLCIARALVKKPKIIILDDSTSAVDTATDASIRHALKHKLSGTTTIIIAQRIASVMDADRIIVMNEGRIDGFGTHEQLMATNAIYREVHDSQQKGVA